MGGGSVRAWLNRGRALVDVGGRRVDVFDPRNAGASKRISVFTVQRAGATAWRSDDWWRDRHARIRAEHLQAIASEGCAS